ncbi:hypothetical protein [Myxococcus stipitatus]|nr:hypothetical protein [Myxococcus stipitatus]
MRATSSRSAHCLQAGMLVQEPAPRARHSAVEEQREQSNVQ